MNARGCNTIKKCDFSRSKGRAENQGQQTPRLTGEGRLRGEWGTNLIWGVVGAKTEGRMANFKEDGLTGPLHRGDSGKKKKGGI